MPSLPGLAELPASVWLASQLGRAGVETLPSGYRQLDAQLPGAGWPAGILTELIAREPGIGELRLLIPLLRQLTHERRFVVLLAPPLIPYAPALADFGVDLRYLLVVQARNAADRLWAIDQTLRSATFGALLAWLPQAHCQPVHLRRMQSSAQGAQGPAFLFRELPAQFQSSPAPLRLLLQPQADEHLSVQILKRRGPLMARPISLELPVPPMAIRLRPALPEPGAGQAADAAASRSPALSP